MDDVISLGVGEPDFQTPWAVRQKAVQVIETKRTVYTANAGLEALRRSVSEYTKKKIGVEYDPVSEIVITVGGSEAIDISIRTLVEPGDEVLIVEPSFVCLPKKQNFLYFRFLTTPQVLLWNVKTLNRLLKFCVVQI